MHGPCTKVNKHGWKCPQVNQVQFLGLWWNTKKLKARVQENVQRLNNVRLRFRFWEQIGISPSPALQTIKVKHILMQMNLAYWPLNWIHQMTHQRSWPLQLWSILLILPVKSHWNRPSKKLGIFEFLEFPKAIACIIKLVFYGEIIWEIIFLITNVALQWSRWLPTAHSSPKETQLFWSCPSFGEECRSVNLGPNVISEMLLITICRKPHLKIPHRSRTVIKHLSASHHWNFTRLDASRQFESCLSFLEECMSENLGLHNISTNPLGNNMQKTPLKISSWLSDPGPGSP